MGHILVNLEIVGGAHQRVEFHAQLMLRRGDLVMVLLHRQAHLGHGRGHFSAQVVGGIDRRHGEIAALDARAMAPVALFKGLAGGGGVLVGVVLVGHAVRFGAETHVVENEELGFRAEIGGVAEPGRFHIGLGALGGRTRVALIGLAGRGLDHVAGHDQHRLGRERVHHGGVAVGHQGHVGFVDGLPAFDRRAVEHDALGQQVLIDGADMLRDMLPFSARVGETEIDILDVVFLDQFENFLGHNYYSLSLGGCGKCRAAMGRSGFRQRRCRVRRFGCGSPLRSRRRKSCRRRCGPCGRPR